MRWIENHHIQTGPGQIALICRRIELGMHGRGALGNGILRRCRGANRNGHSDSEDQEAKQAPAGVNMKTTVRNSHQGQNIKSSDPAKIPNGR
jgi:hypothetical protein